ncbi:hypothetical protein OAI26_02010 [Sulfitobacter sp.]|nr:hypothetical protein [Sulfitobacter sp.]
MTLKVKDNEIYDQNGDWLKSISCPKKLTKRDLDVGLQGNYSCKICEKTIYNTDIMSEQQIVDLTKEQPDVCLSINLKNPLFEFVD